MDPKNAIIILVFFPMVSYDFPMIWLLFALVVNYFHAFRGAGAKVAGAKVAGAKGADAKGCGCQKLPKANHRIIIGKS